MCDIDLSILGRPVELFESYGRRVRAEYAWLPESAWRAGRTRVLEDLLRREPLFQTPSFQRRYEPQARANLRRALAALAPADKSGAGRVGRFQRYLETCQSGLRSSPLS